MCDEVITLQYYVKIINKYQYTAYFFAFVSGYGSAKIIKIGQDLTEFYS